MLPRRSSLDPDNLYLSSLAVAPTARRRGIGAALLQAAIERAVEREASGIWLHVERSNVGAIALYEAGGFTKQPDSPRHAAFTSALE